MNKSEVNRMFLVTLKRKVRPDLFSRKRGVGSLLIAMAVSVGGCAQTGGQDGLTALLQPTATSTGTANLTTGSITNGDGKTAQLTPQDIQTVISRARALQDDGKPARALTALARAHLRAPKNEDLLAAYAKTAIEQGQGTLALDVISKADPSAPKDHRLLSLRGAALAMVGKHGAAHKAFKKALKQSPEDPDLLNNLAMSHALKGDVREAEVFLRKAMGQTNDKRVRQNLALVLGLQGRFGEAKKIAVARSAVAVGNKWTATTKTMLGAPPAAY